MKMSNENHFHFFHFTPSKLNEERVMIEKTFKNSQRKVLKKRSQFNLPILLEAIRKLNMEDLPKFIETLRKMDVLLLIYEYPFREETSETKMKINRILGEKYINTVGRTAWALFQQDVEDPFINELLQLSFEKEKTGFLGIEPEFLEPFAYAFTAEDGIIKGFIPFLKTTKVKSREVLKKWKIKESSALEKHLFIELLAGSLTEDFVIKRDGVNFITEFFNQISSNQYKKLLKLYIEARNYKQFHFNILDQAIRRLMDPREKPGRMEFSFL